MSPSLSAAMCCLLAAAKASSAVLSPVTQRAEVNWLASNRTGRPYSSSISRGQHLELKRAHHADDKARTDARFEHLCGAFFGKLHQGLFQMLCLQRVARPTGLQKLGAKEGCP